MPRKPVDKAPSPREAIWAAIRKAHEAGLRFSAPEIADATGANTKTVRDYFKGLTAAGYLKPDDVAHADAEVARWVLARDIGHEAPRVRLDGSSVTQGEVKDQLWRGMYMLKDFTYLDLVETASITIPPESAKSYCRMLMATGYLRVLRKAEPSKGHIARYRLIRNNGPKAPQIQRVKRVYDPNSREVFMPGAQQ